MNNEGKYDFDEREAGNASIVEIEKKGYESGKKYVQENYDKLINMNIKGENYLRGFLRGMQEEYSNKKALEQEQNTQEPPQRS